MGIAGKGVQEEVSQTMPRQVVSKRHVLREDDPFGIDAAGGRLSPQILPSCWIIEEPEHAAVNRPQNTHPGIEYAGQDLDGFVETAKDKGAIRQAKLGPCHGLVADPPTIVVRLI